MTWLALRPHAASGLPPAEMRAGTLPDVNMLVKSLTGLVPVVPDIGGFPSTLTAGLEKD